jgi:hypothetical protein
VKKRAKSKPVKATLITSNRAAEIIGCSPQHVRTLIYRNKIRAKKNKRTDEWEIPLIEAEMYSQVQPSKGWPRGKKRI